MTCHAAEPSLWIRNLFSAEGSITSKTMISITNLWHFFQSAFRSSQPPSLPITRQHYHPSSPSRPSPSQVIQSCPFLNPAFPNLFLLSQVPWSVLVAPAIKPTLKSILATFESGIKKRNLRFMWRVFDDGDSVVCLTLTNVRVLPFRENPCCYVNAKRFAIILRLT